MGTTGEHIMDKSCVHKRDIIECLNLSNFQEYEEKIYAIYLKLYEDSILYYEGFEVKMKHYPPTYDQKSGFYHLVCQNYNHTNNDVDRVPNLRRYEKITWANQLLINCSNIKCSNLLIWENIRKGKRNILLYCKDIDYLVVLGKRRNYLLLVTAYPIEKDHTRRKLMKEYNKYLKTNNAI